MRIGRLYLLFSVITSYSIHYTKLYDFASQLGNDDLFHRATHDPLTGLANRSLFMDRLRNVIARRHRAHTPAGVVMLDMDRITSYNVCYTKLLRDRPARQTGRNCDSLHMGFPAFFREVAP